MILDKYIVLAIGFFIITFFGGWLKSKKHIVWKIIGWPTFIIGVILLALEIVNIIRYL